MATPKNSTIEDWVGRPPSRGINLVQCATCIHFRAYERGRTVCDAYPGAEGAEGDPDGDSYTGEGEIPVEIILSEVDHNKPYKGDHGIHREEGNPQTKAPADDDDDSSTFARFAYNPQELRDQSGEWTTGGNVGSPTGGTPRGTGRAPGAAWEGRNTASVKARAGTAGTTRAESPHAVYANLGITAFRGQTTPSMQDVARYYGSTRFKGFENELLKVCASSNVRMVEEIKAAGVWEGNLEPAASVTVKGAAGAIRAVAAWLGARYYQDSVMVFTPHAQGAKGGMYVLDGVTDVGKALSAMKANNLPGGRVVGTRLEIADDAGEYRPQPQDVANLATALGLRKQYTLGSVEWLNAGEAYKKGAHGRG